MLTNDEIVGLEVAFDEAEVLGVEVNVGSRSSKPRFECWLWTRKAPCRRTAGSSSSCLPSAASSPPCDVRKGRRLVGAQRFLLFSRTSSLRFSPSAVCPCMAASDSTAASERLRAWPVASAWTGKQGEMASLIPSRCFSAVVGAFGSLLLVRFVGESRLRGSLSTHREAHRGRPALVRCLPCW